MRSSSRQLRCTHLFSPLQQQGVMRWPGARSPRRGCGVSPRPHRRHLASSRTQNWPLPSACRGSASFLHDNRGSVSASGSWTAFIWITVFFAGAERPDLTLFVCLTRVCTSLLAIRFCPVFKIKGQAVTPPATTPRSCRDHHQGASRQCPGRRRQRHSRLKVKGPWAATKTPTCWCRRAPNMAASSSKIAAGEEKSSLFAATRCHLRLVLRR
jgi:hypothetical protein